MSKFVEISKNKYVRRDLVVGVEAVHDDGTIPLLGGLPQVGVYWYQCNPSTWTVSVTIKWAREPFCKVYDTAEEADHWLAGIIEAMEESE